MSRPGYRHLAIAAVSLLALAACDQTGTNAGDGAAGRAAGPQASATVRMVERDVEAPDVFQADESALWDGRPSLGGVWVAHPEVDDPERVIIRNDSNGKFVIGALFRRERENPGPRIQVSSDAASALGLLAGAPTVLNVTALRRVEEPDAGQVVQPAPVQTVQPTRPAADTEAPRTAAAQPDTQPATARPQAAGAAPAAAAPISVAELPRSRPDAGQAAAPQTAPNRATATQRPSVTAEPQVALAGAAGPSGPTRPGAPRLSSDAITAATGGAATATGPARTQGTARAPAATPARATAQPRETRIDRAYIQIGIFSIKDNATRTTQRMRGAGLQANMLEEQSQGQTFWRVTVGPAATTQERARVLANVKGMGFTDAYAVSR